MVTKKTKTKKKPGVRFSFTFVFKRTDMFSDGDGLGEGWWRVKGEGRYGSGPRFCEDFDAFCRTVFGGTPDRGHNITIELVQSDAHGCFVLEEDAEDAFPVLAHYDEDGRRAVFLMTGQTDDLLLSRVGYDKPFYLNMTAVWQ